MELLTQPKLSMKTRKNSPGGARLTGRNLGKAHSKRDPLSWDGWGGLQEFQNTKI